MKTVFLRLFYKDLDKLNDQGIKAQVKEIILSVESSSKATEIKSLKKLKGYKHAFRIKMGDYRIGVFIVNDTVEFARIAHRREVYRIFP